MKNIPPNPRKRVHTFIKPEVPGKKKMRPCKRCYNKLRETVSSREADKKVRHVISCCDDCPQKPAYCLNCFNTGHI
ncbi:hypothetical protein NQ314_002559 [Rhamnusium bicolor]|uniref:PiggyBac transposable element-derived protein 4 C-terminal zinc-ribbon domain-containing protein n=1 Tax=Rhamnusium bicolor TaxID=1586634 RepID=A0AAV8ZRM4_9CUCU|nr:hypothetical protein NQ314_002559 [Rhamnusium bicolor]